MTLTCLSLTKLYRLYPTTRRKNDLIKNITYFQSFTFIIRKWRISVLIYLLINLLIKKQCQSSFFIDYIIESHWLSNGVMHSNHRQAHQASLKYRLPTSFGQCLRGSRGQGIQHSPHEPLISAINLSNNLRKVIIKLKRNRKYANRK